MTPKRGITRQGITLPPVAVRVGLISAGCFGVAAAGAAGHLLGIGPWRMIVFLSLVACVHIGLIGFIRVRKRRTTLSLIIALLLGPVGINVAEADTWASADHTPAAAFSGLSTGCLAAAWADDGGGGLAAAQDSGVWCVLGIFGAIGATGACIAAIAAALAASPATWPLLLAVVLICDFGTVGAILAALLACLGGGGGNPPKKPELDT